MQNDDRTTSRPLLSEQALRAVLKTWTVSQCQLFTMLTNLPPEPDADVWDQAGFFFAIDFLGSKPPAVKVLLDVADELTVRPTYDGLIDLADRLLKMKVEVKQLVRSRQQNQTKGKNQLPTRKIVFVRRAPVKGAAKPIRKVQANAEGRTVKDGWLR